LGTTDFDKNPFNNTRKILDEVHRVLKQNGLFVDLYASKDGTSYKDYLKHIAQLTDPEIEEIFRGKFEEKQHNVLVKV
jgi:ubiquinone/menaquinone biosynthesis C-methylase UbiE